MQTTQKQPYEKNHKNSENMTERYSFACTDTHMTLIAQKGIKPLFMRKFVENFGIIKPLTSVVIAESPIEEAVILEKKVSSRKWAYPLNPDDFPYIDRNGYRVLLIDGKPIREHIYVWIQAYGPIPKGMVIHHINLDKIDNHLENLQMLTKKEHAELHARLNALIKQNALQNAIAMGLHIQVSNEFRHMEVA